MSLKCICWVLFFIVKCASSLNEENSTKTPTVISNSTAMFISFGLTALIMTTCFIIINLSRKYCCCCCMQFKTDKNYVSSIYGTLESRELIDK